MADDVQTVSQLAKKWGMSSTMVRRLAAQGRLTGAAKTKGGHYRLPKSVQAPKPQKPGPKPKGKK